mmetsp:Transcript_29957/g.75493  ORF Transcript_29957/g.75493 Transcript_29957/m.75493 type:complete len:233 (+) Transcript_29957:267-965(+)
MRCYSLGEGLGGHKRHLLPAHRSADAILGDYILPERIRCRLPPVRPPQRINQYGEPPVKDGVDVANRKGRLSSAVPRRAARHKPHRVLSASALVRLRRQAGGELRLNPTCEEVIWIVVPQHHPLPRPDGARRQQKLLMGATMPASRMQRVREEEKQTISAARPATLHANSPPLPRRRMRVMRQEPPRVKFLRQLVIWLQVDHHPLCSVCYLLLSHVLHGRRDLLHKPLLQWV